VQSIALVREAPMVAPVVPAVEPPRPVVESLPSARTASRGARLRHAGRSLAEGSALGVGDTLDAAERAGCVEIEPAIEACLAPSSSVTLSALQPGARRLTLVRGRLVARGHEAPGDARVSVELDGVMASTQRGAFAIERGGDAVRVRALRGPVSVESAGATRDLGEGESALVHHGALTVASAQTAQLQRDWDVLAAGLHQHQASASRPSRPHAAPKLGDDVLAETLQDEE
jgi:hypothetical protein